MTPTRSSRFAPLSRRLGRPVSLLLASLLVTAALPLSAAQAAAVAVTVTTTVDTPATGAASGACASTTVLVPAAPLSLREAVCLSNNLARAGNTVTVNVPAGTYDLTFGQLRVADAPNAVQLAGGILSIAALLLLTAGY